MTEIQMFRPSPKGEVTLADGRMQIVFRRSYRKPIEKVWAALTTSERLADWFGAAEVDLRPEGKFRFTYPGGYSVEMQITRLDAPRVLAWAWKIDDIDTSVLFELTPSRLMSRYNAWQNASLVTAADGLSGEARWEDRGAFFQSIAATLNHLYWADALTLERLQGNERPEETIRHSLTNPADWEDFKQRRLQRDAEIEAWSARLRDADLEGTLVWYPGDGSTRIKKPKAVCVMQLFNHQTHHRGQVHAMLTAAGARPEPTDLYLLG